MNQRKEGADFGIKVHIVSSLLIALVCYVVTRSILFSSVVVISGVLIDLDHLVEYWSDRGFSLSVSKFFQYSEDQHFTRYILLLHSFELLLLLTAVAVFAGPQSLYSAVVIGFGVHMALDYYNVVRNLGFRRKAIVLFSFIYRAKHRFMRASMDLELK